MSSSNQSFGSDPIAIVGLSCKYAGDASSPEKLWELLAEGRSAWSEIPASRFNPKGAYHPNSEKLGTSHVRGAHFLDEDLALFDAAFFGYSAETAAALDPQFRLQLESVYEALENAGLPLSQIAGSKTSVFGGTFVHDYRDALVRDEDNTPRFFITGVGSAMASNRISHFFDFRGASMTIDTGCSTTLVALHQAVQSLRSGECDMSIVGGANVLLNPDNFKHLGATGFLSPDGKCFSFDTRANGYGRGEGVATVVIKRLKDAVAAGDPIRAVIRETVLNQDGKTETLTSPSQEAQEALMRECYSKAGIDPLTTQYFEAHGTGTAAGDPIEAGAIGAVFEGHRRKPEEPLRIGSVKTNIGHTEAASGLASIIKVVLAMEKGLIPPSINFEKPNPKLALEEWRLKIATELEEWSAAPGSILRASVNNFGYGGANAHVIMDQATSSLPALGKPVSNGTNGTLDGHDSANYTTKLLILSAKDEQACRRMVDNLKDFLVKYEQYHKDDVEIFLQSLAYTLGQRRTLFPWVAAFPVPTTQGVGEVINSLKSPKFRPSRTSRRPRIGMVFTGQGAQWYAMGRELITAYPVFKASIEEADMLLKQLGADWSLVEELHRDAKTTRVNGTAFSIPICIAVQVSLVRLLRTWGVTPAAVTSHSSGEIAAAYTVGAISFRSAIGIAYYRSKLAADMTLEGPVKGGMLAVGLGSEDSERYIERLTCGAKAVVACINSPSSTTLAGDVAAIEELEAMLKADDVFARRLKVDTAYHSHHMEPIAKEYHEALCNMPPDETTEENQLKSIAFASAVTGFRLTSAKKIAHADHWVGSLLKPVQFIDAFTEMVLGDLENAGPSVDIVVEVGPHTALGGPIQQILELPEFDGIQLPYYGCLVRHTNAVESIQTLAANLLREGYPLDIEAVNFPGGRDPQVRVLTNLPSYPWVHQTRHWVEHRFNLALRQRDQVPHDLLGQLVPGTNPQVPTWRHILRANESPWVKDHVIQSNMLYPGCGYISLAIEAITQQLAKSETEDQQKISGYQVRDVNVLMALVIPDSAEGIEIQTVLRPASQKDIGVQGWKQFEVYSVTADNLWTQHAQGLITVEFEGSDKEVEFDDSAFKALDPSSGYARRIDPTDMWNVLASLGLQYGPTFKNISNIIQSGRELKSVSTITIADTSVPKDLPRNHVVHPSTLDAAAQAGFTALPGVESHQDSPRVFQSIGNLWISSKISHEYGHSFQCYTSLKHADAQGIDADIVLADENGPQLKIDGLVFASLGRDAAGNTKPWENELCTKIVWDSDPDLKFNSLDAQPTKLLSSLAHKNPRARILEIGSSLGDVTRAWLQALGTKETGGPLAGFYHFTNASDEDFETAREEFADWSEILAFDKLDVGLDPSVQGFEAGTYDVVLVSAPQAEKDVANIRSLIKPGGRLLTAEPAGNGLSSETLPAEELTKLPASSDVVFVTNTKASLPPSAWLKSLQESLPGGGNKPILHTLESSTAAAFAGKICVFLGEIERPLLRDVDAATLEALKAMVIGCKGLLWVTRGGAVDCQNPELALAWGFLRTLRNEYLGRPYISLDLDPNAPLWSAEDVSAIVQILEVGFDSSSASSEFEYAVRDGAIQVPRIVKDKPRNDIATPVETDGLETTMEPLHQADGPLSLQVGRPGSLDTLAFDVDESISTDMSPDAVEIEPRAFGVNNRDVAVAMGQLHEGVMGLECAGVITRVGSDAAKQGYAAGDGVFCLLRGPMGSRARTEWTNVSHMPEGLSFEEAASLPSAFCTAYMSLVDVAHVEAGSSVLIHAASGGIGQAAIMVARHLGAEVFVTVGTPEQRELVTSRYAIPAERVFSSTDASFAASILAATNARGVDVVLNSLAGSLLQQSFNVVAPFGHFIDLGSRDMDANNHLEMRPFTRHLSFSAFDLHALAQHKPRQVHRTLQQISRLLQSGALAPVYPVTAYPIADVADAFRALQTETHAGKVVLSAGPQHVVPVVRRAPTPKFSADASYLLVGGMGGIGRSIAYWMVAHGARNIIFMSRSAGRSGASSTFVQELTQAGCRVKPVSCDVTSEADVARAVQSVQEDGLPPIRGVIQAAMVLQDSILEQMTHANFQSAIRPKVHGTWNLHKQFSHADALDFFVILSSVVGVAGNASQSNYAAAGSYEDALAHWRVSRGLPGVAIDLGAVKAIGVAAENSGVIGRLQRTGHIPLSEDQVLGVLSSAILAPFEPQVVVGLNSGPGKHWDANGEAQLGRDARYAALRVRETGAKQQGGAGADAEQLGGKLAAAASLAEAVAIVGAAVAEKLSDIFLLPVEDIELANRPAQYGIDSLVAVELRNMLVQQAGAEVSIFGIMQSASLAALAADVAAKSVFVDEGFKAAAAGGDA